jgi:ATP-dependent DNA helicase PIF1
MALLNSLKKLLGITPVSVAELNRRATHAGRQLPRWGTGPSLPADLVVTPEYQTIMSLIQEGTPVIFVSGNAGTGKTTLVHYIRSSFGKNVVVLAPTGVAAINAGGATIHSFFHFPPRIITKDDIKHLPDRRLYTKLDLILVDEVSMVRADLIDAMDMFLRSNGRDRESPFGGVQIVFIGDLFQLPPVVEREEESALLAMQYTSPFFFSARSLQDCEMVPIELTKVFRQQDEQFIEMLNHIRVAENVKTVVAQINEACSHKVSNTNSTLTLTCTNAAADEINLSKLAMLQGDPVTFIGEISGKFASEKTRLPSPCNLCLKLGAQVMFTKNDSQQRWVNGTVGRVVGIKSGSIQVELLTDHSGTVYDVQRVTWETYKYEYDEKEDRIRPLVTGYYIQFPLMLAWAVTIHKGQGKTLENVCVDLGRGAFASGQVYVALSRCRSLRDISLARPISFHEVKCDERIKHFYLALAELQRDNENEE